MKNLRRAIPKLKIICKVKEKIINDRTVEL